MRKFDVTFDPPRTPHAKTQHIRATLVLAHASSCPTCGEAFVRERSSRRPGRPEANCSNHCAHVARARLEAAWMPLAWISRMTGSAGLVGGLVRHPLR
jgi:hypothetical protein